MASWWNNAPFRASSYKGGGPIGNALGLNGNAIYDSLHQHRNALGQAFAGLTDAKSFGEGAQRVASGALAGDQLDLTELARQKQLSDQQDKISKTAAGLTKMGRQDLADIVSTGTFDPTAAWNLALTKAPAPAPYTLGAGETRFGADNQPVATGGVDNKDQFGYEDTLWKDYQGTDEAKQYKVIKSGYEKMRSGASQGSGPGDISLVYGYMKMLDPTSVVREGEYATATNAAGIPEYIRGLYNKAKDGQFLSPETRGQFIQSAESIYADSASNLQDVNQQFQPRLAGYNVDPSHVLINPEKYAPIDIGGGYTIHALNPSGR